MTTKRAAQSFAFSFLLPHEIAFLIFFATTSIRLALASQRRFSILFGVLGFIVIALAAWVRQRPSSWRWKVRLFAYAGLMTLSYRSLGFCSRWMKVAGADWLQKGDQWMIGGNASVRIEAMTSPVWSDLFAFLYLGFFIYIGWSLWHYGRSGLPLLRAFMSGLFTVYAVGFLGYTIVSAAGPYLEMAASFSRPIQGGFLTHAYDAIVLKGTNRTDCFPCLHVAVSAFILLFDRRQSSCRFWWMLLPCVGIWFSTIYLRQHYFTDLAAGALLTAFGLWIARHSTKAEELAIDIFNVTEKLSINATPSGGA